MNAHASTAEAVFFAPNPVALSEHMDWLRHRYEAHVYDAFTFHREARRRLRSGLMWAAKDNYRIALRHVRMAKHFREQLL